MDRDAHRSCATVQTRPCNLTYLFVVALLCLYSISIFREFPRARLMQSFRVNSQWYTALHGWIKSETVALDWTRRPAAPAEKKGQSLANSSFKQRRRYWLPWRFSRLIRAGDPIMFPARRFFEIRVGYRCILPVYWKAGVPGNNKKDAFFPDGGELRQNGRSSGLRTEFVTRAHSYMYVHTHTYT